MIIIKKLLILGALGASALGVNAQKADAATVKRTVNHSQGVSVFTNYENAGYTGELLQTGDQVDVYDTKTDLAGNKWIKIGEGQWIMEEYTVSADSTGSTYSQSSQSSTGSTYGQSGSSYGQSSTYGSSSQSGSTYGSTGSSYSQSSTSGSTGSTYGQSGSSYGQSSTYGSTSQSSQGSTYGSTYGSSSQSSSTNQASQSSSTKNQQVSQSPHEMAQAQKPSASAGLSSNEHAAKEWIAQRESGGSYTAQNGQYYGRYQLSRSYLNGDYSSANQEKVANNYVKNRYGSWSNAKSFWQTHGWY